MDNNPTKDTLARVKDISSIAAAIVIPLILGFTGYFVNSALKKREAESKMVELAVNILLSKPQLDRENQQTKENIKLRSWAIDVIEQYSGVKMPEDARQGLEKAPLPTPSTKALTLNIDYSQLERLLADKKYKEADEETRRIMYEISGLDGGYIDIRAMNQIPCEDIRLLDKLWVQSSDGKFGFSVQRNIWKNNPTTSSFGNSVGWRKESGQWLTVGELKYDLSAPRGHLPSRSPGTSDKLLSGGWLVWWLLPGISNSNISACFDSNI